MYQHTENPMFSDQLNDPALYETQAETATKKPSWGERFDLIKDYFVNSDEKRIAWLLFFGIVFCVVGFVALNVLVGWLFTGVWVALTANAMIPFFIALGELAAALSGMAILYAIQNYCSGKLAIKWRNWLSNKIMDQLYKEKEYEKGYIDVKRTSIINDISQRIQEDVREFVDLSICLGSGFLNSTLTLGVFIGALWILGGALTLVVVGLNIVIPGYLVWAAIIIAVVASVITYFIGKSLPDLNNKEVQAEASLRQHLEIFNTEAENISLERTEDYHLRTIKADMENLQDTGNQKLETQTALIAFQSLYNNFTIVAPYLLTAPLYFTGCIGLEMIGQVGMCFSQVSQALGWFAQSYEELSKYTTKMDRIIEIQHAIEQGNLKANPKDIVVNKNVSSSIIMKHLNIQRPLNTETNYIMRDLNLELKQGEHTLILGASGLGKSTLFKAISGNWRYGNGEIMLPKGKSRFFLSQKPAVVDDTFSAMLASPKPSSAYTKEQYLWAINLVGSLDTHLSDLDKKQDWSRLSGGEKQMVAFVRALLQRPDWLFLDEVTSSLDEDAEFRLYELLKRELKDTTIVSIAHRSTVKVHHDRVIKFGCPNEKRVMEVVSDERNEGEFRASI